MLILIKNNHTFFINLIKAVLNEIGNSFNLPKALSHELGEKDK